MPDEGYFDLQVNGYDGIDFNADGLTSDALRQACVAMRADGVEQALATVITADLPAMKRRIGAIAAACKADEVCREFIPAIHVEGPFINSEPGYVGAHPVAHARVATIEVAEQLLTAGQGMVRVLTLAPERDPGGTVTAWLRSKGVCVAGGHSDATLDELKTAIDAGLSLFTHLGNGCPLIVHRHDNIIQRVLSLRDQLWITFIADGVHVPLTALGNYLSLAGTDGVIVVSDAMAAAGRGPGTYRLGEQEVVVDERLATWSADRTHLVGSACTLKQMAANLRAELGLDETSIDQLMRLNPRAALVRRRSDEP